MIGARDCQATKDGASLGRSLVFLAFPFQHLLHKPQHADSRQHKLGCGDCWYGATAVSSCTVSFASYHNPPAHPRLTDISLPRKVSLSLWQDRTAPRSQRILWRQRSRPESGRVRGLGRQTFRDRVASSERDLHTCYSREGERGPEQRETVSAARILARTGTAYHTCAVKPAGCPGLLSAAQPARLPGSRIVVHTGDHC